MSERLVALEQDRSVLVARMQRGVTNAINASLVRELADMVEAAEGDSGIKSLVLTSANAKFFSIGLDIPTLVDQAPAEFAVFYDSFSRLCISLFGLAKPTVAAIPGHATAGGCILALCCDYRIIAEGRKLIGLNEIKLGVPVPFVADCVLRALVGYRRARDIVDGGEFHMPDQALALGIIDAVLPPKDLLSASIEKARQLGETPGMAFNRIKASRTAGVLAEVSAGLQARNCEFVEAWASPDAQARLREAAAKF